ncbi:MAG: peptidoglycan-binding protein [Defluviimonas sp.]|uniref:peptidoglycan-binding protein n=1 Tax=Albidovulum sp. TaxID=1872424 RepID=UPI001D5EF590|nr:peptidoglycan-binding protein [Paracoccaceae bacterium]MCC0064724.1 peptidoglycan-binding protein [Defluviimonas sp.]
MLPTMKRNFIGALAALSLVAAAPAPALAWGEKEQNALVGLVAAGIIGTLIYNDARKKQAVPAARGTYQDPYGYGRAPRRHQTQTQWQYQPRQPVYTAPTNYLPDATAGLYDSPAARAFGRYTPGQRRLIQARLANAGYYSGRIDGAFGPMTYRAVMAIADDATGRGQMSSMQGAIQFYDALLG